MRVGVVGPGYVGVRHLEAWRQLGVRLHAYTRSATRRAEVGAAYPEVDWHRSLAALFAAVDVVDLCTPTDTHADLTVLAAANGRHVICEKPIARTVEQGERMVRDCAQAGVNLHIGHIVRYITPYAQARDAVLTGEIGRPTRLRLSRCVARPGWSTWFADPDRSGGVLLDLGIHDIDFARWVAGDVVGTESRGIGPDRACLVLAHAGGAVSEVTAVWGPPGEASRATFEILGTDGSVGHDSAGTSLNRESDPLVEMLGEFRAAIRGADPVRVTPADALAALRIATSVEVGSR